MYCVLPFPLFLILSLYAENQGFWLFFFLLLDTFGGFGNWLISYKELGYMEEVT